MWLLLSAPALAASFFVSVGTPTELVGGGWGRVLPAESGWSLFFSAGGTYWMLPMADDLSVVDRGRYDLTGRDDLQDHGFVPCPDGTYLHVASASGAATNDTAWLFLYDNELKPIVAREMISGDTTVRTNDMALVCDDGLRWAGFSGNPSPERVYDIAADGTATVVAQSASLPQLMGGSLVPEAERGEVMSLGRRYGSPLVGQRLGRDGALTGDPMVFSLAAEGEDAYWPSSVLRIGDHYLVAYMWRVDDGSFQLDEGNVRLAVFDLEWSLVETVQITDYTAPHGCMRPGLGRRDERLIVTFDRDTTVHGVPVELDLAAFGVEPTPDDTGGDSGDSGDSGDNGGSDSGAETGNPDTDGDTAEDDYRPRDTGEEPAGCGCASGSTPAQAGVALGLALVVTRRRRQR